MPPKQPYDLPPPDTHYGKPTTLRHPHQVERHPDGHYEVVAPPQPAPNDGHSGHNPYEFIVNPDKPKRPSFGAALASGSLFLRVGLLAGGVVVLLAVAAAVISALTPKGPVPGLTSIVQRQQEIVRVATEATTQAQNQDAQNFVTNIEVGIGSAQQQMTSYLAAHGTKLSPQILALDQDPQTDTQLTNAATANDYDGAATDILAGQLRTYQALLRSTYTQTDNPKTRALLQSNYDGAGLLLKQAAAVSAELQKQGS